MINWEELYYMVCERISDNGHDHHVVPQHTRLENNTTTIKLSFRNHVLAHYIRYKWLHEKGDRMAVQILIRKKIPKFDDEKEVVYKKKSKTNSIHPQIIVVSTPIIIENIIVRKYVKKKKKTKEPIKRNNFPGLDKKLKQALRSKTLIGY